MITYALFQEQGRNREKTKVCEFRFLSAPHPGDTIDIEPDVWTIERAHWTASGGVILIVRKHARGLVPA